MIKNYIPDFIKEEGYVEIKGYETEQWKAKKDAFPHKLTVLTKEEMAPILAFVIAKYGKDYTKLYDTFVDKRKPLLADGTFDE